MFSLISADHGQSDQITPKQKTGAWHDLNSLPPTISALGRCCTLAAVLLGLGACASNNGTPSVPWLLGTTILSAAGVPPKRPDFYDAPARVGEALKFNAIAAGADHTCAIEIAGDTWCWGSNQYQQLGSATTAETCASARLTCSSTPVRVQDAPRFTVLAASIWGTCGLDTSGRAHCWGFGLAGRQTDGLPASSGVPIEVPGGHEFVALTASASGNQTCGLTSGGEAWCWAPGADTSFGGVQTSVFTGPERVATDAKFIAIAVGAQHGCGVNEALDTLCWGSNQFGQLGAGASALEGGLHESSAPIAVRGARKFHGVVAGPGHSCGLISDGPVYCWGQSFAGAAPQVPDRRSIPHSSVPTLVGTPNSQWLALGAGTTQTCALSAKGDLYCFPTTPTFYDVDRGPARIESDQAFVAFAVGGQHVCAIGADRFAYCWGLSHLAQAGRPPAGR